MKPPLSCDYDNSSISSMHEHFSIREIRKQKESIGTGHNNIIIKPTLQYNYNSHLDLPCTSVSTQFKQEDERS
jgi:hypothetical protein